MVFRAFIRNNVSSEHLVFGTDAENLGSLMLPHDVKSKILKLAESHKCFSPEYLNVQVMAYCGLDCGYLRRETAEKSVQIAISHMNEQFRVIVVAEQLLSSVKLLERVVPDFFSGLNEKAATMLRLFAQTTPVPTPAPTPLPSPAPSPSPIPIPVQEVVQPFRCPNRDGYCSCDGTLYYGQAYVDAVRYRPSYDGQMLSFEDMIKIKHVSRDVVSKCLLLMLFTNRMTFFILIRVPPEERCARTNCLVTPLSGTRNNVIVIPTKVSKGTDVSVRHLLQVHLLSSQRKMKTTFHPR